METFALRLAAVMEVLGKAQAGLQTMFLCSLETPITSESQHKVSQTCSGWGARFKTTSKANNVWQTGISSIFDPMRKRLNTSRPGLHRLYAYS